MQRILLIMAILLSVSTSEPLAAIARQAQPGSVSTFTTEHFSGSGSCAFCHDGLTDSFGNDVSLRTSWSGSIMRFAFVDPLWRAKVSTEIRRAPQLQVLIEKKCSRCHAPMANVEAEFAGEPAAIFGDGFANLDNPYYEAAMEGVSCTLCHQVEDSPDLGTDAANSGKFTVGELPPPARPLYGQYEDVFVVNMQERSGYTPEAGSHISRSEACAVCHDLKTPYVDAAGQLASTADTEFPEQMPYREWLLSAYAADGTGARSCQDCHMPATDGVPLSRSPRWLPTREGFSRHQFLSGNRMLLEIIDQNEAALHLPPLDLTDEMVDGGQFTRTAAAVELVESSLSQGDLEFTLKISNLTGHKLSTGIPTRRLIVHVTVIDQKGKVVFESGRVNADLSVAGCDADVIPAAYEPHYDLVTSPDQVQIYEGIMGNTDGNVTYTLLRASQFLKDNRLLPRGFDKILASGDVIPVGEALGDADFLGGSDLVSYRIGGLNNRRYDVVVELLEQKVSHAFLRDLYDDTAAAEVAAFRGMMAKTTVPAIPLAAMTARIQAQ